MRIEENEDRGCVYQRQGTNFVQNGNDTFKNEPPLRFVISFDHSFLSICSEGIRTKLLEGSIVLPEDVVSIIREGRPNNSRKLQIFRESIIDYCESLLRNVFKNYHMFYCPVIPNYDAKVPHNVAYRKFDSDLMQQRLECVIKCCVETVAQLPAWCPTFFNFEQTSNVITTVSAFTYFLLIYPVYNFIDGSPNYYEARASQIATNDVRRFFGFWLNYFHNMQIDFTEMALLFVLSLNEACRYLNITVYESRLLHSEEMLRSTLMSYCLSRKFDEEFASATDRWIMLNRNLALIFEGIFESGKLSFEQIGSKLLHRRDENENHHSHQTKQVIEPTNERRPTKRSHDHETTNNTVLYDGANRGDQSKKVIPTTQEASNNTFFDIFAAVKQSDNCTPAATVDNSTQNGFAGSPSNTAMAAAAALDKEPESDFSLYSDAGRNESDCLTSPENVVSD